MLLQRLLKGALLGVVATALGLSIGCASESPRPYSFSGEQVTAQSQSTTASQYPRHFNPKPGRAAAN